MVFNFHRDTVCNLYRIIFLLQVFEYRLSSDSAADHHRCRETNPVYTVIYPHFHSRVIFLKIVRMVALREKGKTDIGVAVTGIAGPTGGSDEKPVGTVFIALTDGSKSFCRHYSFRWDRRRNKIIASQATLIMLKRYLTGELEHEQ